MPPLCSTYVRVQLTVYMRLFHKILSTFLTVFPRALVKCFGRNTYENEKYQWGLITFRSKMTECQCRFPAKKMLSLAQGGVVLRITSVARKPLGNHSNIHFLSSCFGCNILTPKAFCKFRISRNILFYQ